MFLVFFSIMSRTWRSWPALLRKFKMALNWTKDLESAFDIKLDPFPSLFCWRFTFEKYQKLKTSSQSMQMDSEKSWQLAELGQEGVDPYLLQVSRKPKQRKSSARHGIFNIPSTQMTSSNILLATTKCLNEFYTFVV